MISLAEANIEQFMFSNKSLITSYYKLQTTYVGFMSFFEKLVFIRLLQNNCQMCIVLNSQFSIILPAIFVSV